MASSMLRGGKSMIFVILPHLFAVECKLHENFADDYLAHLKLYVYAARLQRAVALWNGLLPPSTGLHEMLSQCSGQAFHSRYQPQRITDLKQFRPLLTAQSMQVG